MITEERLLDIRRVMIAETQGWLSEHVFLKVARVIEREAMNEHRYLLRTCLARLKVEGMPTADIELEIRNLEIEEPK